MSTLMTARRKMPTRVEVSFLSSLCSYVQLFHQVLYHQNLFFLLLFLGRNVKQHKREVCEVVGPLNELHVCPFKKVSRWNVT